MKYRKIRYQFFKIKSCRDVEKNILFPSPFGKKELYYK